MLKKLINDCAIELKLHTVDPMLVKSGLATLSGPDMAFVVTYRNEHREPYIPGSSLKGVIRSHAERIARTLKSPSVCEPFWNDEIEKEVKRSSARAETMWCGERFKRREKTLRQQISNATAYSQSCPACRFFGSTYYVGRFAVSDAYLIEESRSRRPQQRDGVGIDRFTGGASKRAKFDLEVLSEVTFKCTIRIRNFEVWQLGWLAYVIQDLKDEMIQIGSGKSRGLGRVRGEVESVTIGYLVADENLLLAEDGQVRLRGIGSLAQDLPYGFVPNDEAKLPADFRLVRPPGNLRFERRFEQGQDTTLWRACAERWDEYIKEYDVPDDMIHTKFLNARFGGDEDE